MRRHSWVSVSIDLHLVVGNRQKSNCRNNWTSHAEPKSSRLSVKVCWCEWTNEHINLSIKQWRFPISDAVTCCRSSEDGTRDRPNEASSMRRWVLNKHWRKSGLWLVKAILRWGYSSSKIHGQEGDHLLEDIRRRGRPMVRVERSENSGVS